MRSVLTVVLLLSVALLIPVACDKSGGGDSVDTVDDVLDVAADICTPDCSGKECGSDGCGGYCGSCDTGFSCNAQGSCQELPQCELVAKVGCDEPVVGDTSGRDNEQQAYECDGYPGPGPDVAYVFQAQIDDHIKVTLDSGLTDLNILVTQSPCKPESCLAMGDTEFELDVDGGKKYYIVVDGDEGVEGSFSFTIECDSTCEPQCGFAECGDDGCGGECGTCPAAAPECIDGFCEAPCVPECDGLECGDDGCGGDCGTCPAELPFCNQGICEIGCQPDCDGKECGDDGCDGTCGSCAVGFACDEGLCVEGGAGCVSSEAPGCGGCACEECVCELDPYCCNSSWDNICVDECVECGGCGQQPCGDGTCDAEGGENCSTCAEDCACTDGAVCFNATCCAPQCDGLECGDDGCGGTCGDCGAGVCIGGSCCQPQCEGLECGEDGCGGSCGDCGEDACYEGQCVAEGDYCLEVVPGIVDFGTVEVNTFNAQEVLVKNCGAKAISIVAIEMIPEDVTNMGFDQASLPKVPGADDPIVLAPSNGQTVTVVYLPDQPSQTLNGEPIPDTASVHVVAAEAGTDATLTLLGIAVDPQQ